GDGLAAIGVYVRASGRRANPKVRLAIRPLAPTVPNDLEAFWVPFTPNRAFKKAPRLIARAKGMHDYTVDGKAVIDGSAGMWCCNAGHNRDPIVAAIQQQAAELDYPPAFQFSHPKAFELASRIAALAPGDLDHVFFCNSGSEAVDTALRSEGTRLNSSHSQI